jgi:hypothetical protein
MVRLFTPIRDLLQSYPHWTLTRTLRALAACPWQQACKRPSTWGLQSRETKPPPNTGPSYLPACSVLPLDGHITHSHQECCFSLFPIGLLAKAPRRFWLPLHTSRTEYRERAPCPECWRQGPTSYPCYMLHQRKTPTTGHSSTHDWAQLRSAPILFPVLGFPVILHFLFGFF